MQLSDVQDTEEFDLAVCRTQKSATLQCAGDRRVQLSDEQDTEESDLAGMQDTEESDLMKCRTQKSQT